MLTITAFFVVVFEGLVAFKNKIHLSKLEDLIGFIKQFMIQAESHLVSRRVLQGLYKVEDFYRKKGSERELQKGN